MYMLPCVPQESSQNSSDIMPALMELSDDEEAEAVGRPQRVCKLQVATMDVVLVSCFVRGCKSEALPATIWFPVLSPFATSRASSVQAAGSLTVRASKLECQNRVLSIWSSNETYARMIFCKNMEFFRSNITASYLA